MNAGEDAPEVDMKIAIAGAGMAGSYLYRLMREQGFDDVDLFDKGQATRCGTRPCAWGFAPSSEYLRLVSRFADPDRFVLEHNVDITLDGLGMSADLLTVDKPALIKALRGGAEIRSGPITLADYDRVIDATGVDRAYLGPVDGSDMVAELVQYRISTPADLGLWINTSAIGYEWCFPLGKGEYHLGFGNLRSGVGEHDLLHYLDGHQHTVQCRCKSRIRLSSPHYSQPFTAGKKVIGVGESIGTVAPMGGDGNLYSMQCAELLMENWDDPEAYVGKVLKKFGWMRKERLAIERLMAGAFPTTSDMRVFLKHSRMAGFGMGPVNAVRFFTKAIQTDRRGAIKGELTCVPER